MQGYSPFAVARFFLEKARQDSCQLTPMKLLKLVFIAHGWHLAFFNTPLIREEIQAWKYGPVISSLYKMFKEYGSCAIPENQIEILPTLPQDVPPDRIALLDAVWKKYSKLTASQLSTLTHQPGSPWDQVTKGGTVNEKYISIPNNIIQEFYQKKLEN
jgi:uncharacterized phage-associated protein